MRGGWGERVPQNFLASTIVSDYGFRSLGGQQSHQASWEKCVYEVNDDAALPVQWTSELKETCDEAGIDYFTAPYDLELIEKLSPFVCAWKLGSGDITWHDEIERLARDGKPLLMATGAAAFDVVCLAVDLAQRHTADLCVMQCNTNWHGVRREFHHRAERLEDLCQ